MKPTEGVLMRIRHVSDAECEVSDPVVERLHDLRFCVFEREGTGPDPDRDRVIQIGAVRTAGPRSDVRHACA
jgi:DNA polymerase III alpha subunit (gram-positive type)